MGVFACPLMLDPSFALIVTAVCCQQDISHTCKHTCTNAQTLAGVVTLMVSYEMLWSPVDFFPSLSSSKESSDLVWKSICCYDCVLSFETGIMSYYGKDILFPINWFVLWSLSPGGAVAGGEDIDHGVLSELELRRRELQDSMRQMAHVKPQNLSFSWEPPINQTFYSSWISWIYFVSEGYSGGVTMILSFSPASSSLCPLLRCQKTGHLLIKSKEEIPPFS